jgi:hypothetical protein
VSGTPCEIKQGMRVQFVDASDPDLVDGIVNGDPWVYFDGIDAEARIPVFVPASDECMDVLGHNIMRVGGTVSDLRPAYSVRAS